MSAGAEGMDLTVERDGRTWYLYEKSGVESRDHSLGLPPPIEVTFESMDGHPLPLLCFSSRWGPFDRDVPPFYLPELTAMVVLGGQTRFPIYSLALPRMLKSAPPRELFRHDQP